MQKLLATRRTIFSHPQPRLKKDAVAPSLLQAEIATRFSLPRSAPPSFTPSALVRWRVLVLPRSALGMASSRHRFQISSLCTAILPTSCRERPASEHPALRRCCSDMADWKLRSLLAAFPLRQKA